MGALLILILSAAAPPEVRLVAQEVRVVGLEARLAPELTDRLAQRLASPQLTVVTARDISTVLGLERQRQLLGCSESGCLAELTGALGADGVLSGSVTRVGTRVQVSLRVVSAKSATPLANFTRTVDHEDDVLGAIDAGAADLRRQLLPAGEGGEAQRRRWWWLLPGSVGVVALGVAGYGFGTALTDAQTLRTAEDPTHLLSPTALAARGSTELTIGWAAAAVAGAALVTTIVLLLLDGVTR